MIITKSSRTPLDAEAWRRGELRIDLEVADQQSHRNPHDVAAMKRARRRAALVKRARTTEKAAGT